MLYRNFASPAQIDEAYDVENFTPGFRGYLGTYAEHSQKAREVFSRRKECSYGQMIDERVDIFPQARSGGKKPVVVFIHGGGWRMSEAQDYDFVALGLAPYAAVFVVNYTLAPQATFSEMVRQIRSSIAWVYRHADEFDADRHRLYIAGHSAGAHLGVMAAMTDWARDYGLPPDVVKGVVAVSGLYDLRPLPYAAFLASALRLSGRDILELSPMLIDLPSVAPALLLTYGDGEPAEFKRQGQDFFARWRDAGLPGDLTIQSDRNHFSILLDLITDGAPLTRAIAGLMG